MPSAAQIAGADMVRALLPLDATPPKVTIASRDMGDGRGIAFTFWWPEWHGLRGEYRATVVVPRWAGPLRDAAEARLAQLVSRHVQIERVARLHAEEREACDHDPDMDLTIDDDMPMPPWRIHAPLALRRALDEAGIDAEGRFDLVERSTAIQWRGATIGVDDREEEDAPLLRDTRHPEISRATRWVRRATIASSKATWSQGIKKSYLKVHMTMPETLLAAVVGRSPAHIIDLPGLDAPGLVVIGSRTTAMGCEFDITRGFSMLGALPGETA